MMLSEFHSSSFILTIFLSVSTSSARHHQNFFGITSAKRANGFGLYDIRGGSDNTNDDNSSSIPSFSSSVGILDLRPESSSSQILFGNDDGSSSPFDGVMIDEKTFGAFPSSTISGLSNDEEGGNDEGEEGMGYEFMMSQQSAAAETVGSVCESICLLIAYDPNTGSTMLHSTAGIKLASVVNGIRQRIQKQKKEDNMTPTKLNILLFFNHPEIEANKWNDSGINFLVERLRAFFAFGGSNDAISDDDSKKDENALDPFGEINIVPIGVDSNTKATAQGTILAQLSSGSKSSDDISILQTAYETMGGVGNIELQLS